MWRRSKADNLGAKMDRSYKYVVLWLIATRMVMFGLFSFPSIVLAGNGLGVFGCVARINSNVYLLLGLHGVSRRLASAKRCVSHVGRFHRVRTIQSKTLVKAKNLLARMGCFESIS